MKQQDLEKTKEYKYGYITDIESVRAPKGLNEEVIRFISKIKKEPEWMLNWRLKAYNRLKNVKEPNWQKPKPRYTKGVLAKYAKLAQSASRGAITE